MKKKIIVVDVSRILLILSLVIIPIIFPSLATASTGSGGVPSSIITLPPGIPQSYSSYVGIHVRYYVDNLDGISGDETWLDTNSGTLDGSIYVSDDNQWLNLARYASDHFPEFAYVSGDGLKYDANGDGDLKDSGDFTLYDGVYIIDGNAGTIRFAYDVFSRILPSYEDNTDGPNEGEVTLIKGHKYAITGLDEFDSGVIELGPAIVKKISDPGDVDPGSAIIISENYKIFFDDTNTGKTIYFYDGNELLDNYTFNPPFNTAEKLNPLIEVGRFEDKYNIYLINYHAPPEVSYSYISMSFIDKDQTIEIDDEDEGIMGYEFAWVNNSNWSDNLVLLSQVVQLENGEIIDLAGTYYSLEFENESMLDIKRKDIKTQSSGAKWKSSKFKDFLKNTDIWISATGGQIEIKYGKDDLDDDSSNGDDYYQVNNTGKTVLSGANDSNKLKLSSYDGLTPPFIPIAGNGLKFDANGDGDLKDSGDYVLYDGVYIIDGTDGSIRMGYNVSAHYVGGYYNTSDVRV